MAAVQRANRAIDGHLNVGDATRAKVNLHAARLVHRAIADQPAIAREQIAITLDGGRQMRRASLFFAFKKQFQTYGRLGASGFQCVKGDQQRLNGSLIIAR